MTKWIKISGPGEFRGEGQWKRLEDTNFSVDEWNHIKHINFLPTAEQDEEPNE